jgi:hypothetical protein
MSEAKFHTHVKSRQKYSSEYFHRCERLVSKSPMVESDRNVMALQREPSSVTLLGLVHRIYYKSVELVEYKQIVLCCRLLILFCM